MKNAVVFAQVSGSTKSVVATRNGEAIYLAYSLLTVNKPIYEALGGKRVEDIKHFQVDFPSAKNAKEFVKTAKTELSEKDYAAARKTAPKEDIVVPMPPKTKGKSKTDEYVEAVVNGKKVMVLASAIQVDEPKKEAPKKTKGGKKNDKPTFTAVYDNKGNYKGLKESNEPTKKSAPKKVKGDNKPTVAPNAKAGKNAKKAGPKPKQTKGNAVTLTDEQTKHLNICKTSILNRAASAYSLANGGAPINFKDLGKSEKELAKFMPKAKADMLKSDKWAKAVKVGVTEDMLG